jgi:hypothetical protein
LSVSSGEGAVLSWLLEEDQPAVRYFALVDLLGRSPSSEESRSANDQISRRGWAKEILDQQKEGGNWESRKSVYRPKYTATNWRMLVLSDLGLTKKDRRIERTCELFFAEWLKKELPATEGEICIVGNLARMLTRFGYVDDARVKGLFNWIVTNQKDDGGWHCFKSDTGTLDCWEGLGAFAALPRGLWTRSIKRSAERGAEFYLERRLMDEGPRYAPWLRLHYPNHYYYDILVGLDVVTKLGYADDKRLRPALAILQKKVRVDGTWAIDRMQPDFWSRYAPHYRLKQEPKAFALEGPGEPSKWMTLKSLRVLKRVSES